MSLRRKIAYNTAIQMVGKIAGTVLSLVVASLVYRHLHDTGFGQYTTILSFLQIFGILMDLGLYVILVKRMANIDGRESIVVDTIFTVRLISGIIFLAAAPLGAWLISFRHPQYSGEMISGIALTSLFFLFISLNQLIAAIFQKFLRTSWIAIAEFVGKIVLCAATVAVIWLHLGLLAILFTLVLSSATNFFINFFASRKYFSIHFRFDRAVCRSVLTEAWPIALSIAFGLIYFKGDVVVLSFYKTSQEIGWYGAPYKILEVLVSLPAMFTGLALPILAGAWQQQDKMRFQELFQKSFDALAMIALPMIAGTWVLAPMMMTIIQGDDGVHSEHILRILIIATAAIFIGTLTGYIVVAVNRQRAMVWGYFFIALTSLLGYMVVIPRFSITGAAWVTVYSEVAMMLISLTLILRTAHINVGLNRFIKSIVSAAVMYIVLGLLLRALQYFLNNRHITLSHFTFAFIALALLVPLGGIIYLAALFLTRAIRPQELRSLVRIK
ncbi:MAG: oligosaccharide flippase family protein [Candidatus Kerfeldbacteria bacterium]|nr:oligosaccharide flippase family protein [Candidatus Kerfeldbacteria bacterium]